MESLCVRVGAMRCHSQALTHQAAQRTCVWRRIEELLAGGNDWVKVIPNHKEASMPRFPRRR